MADKEYIEREYTCGDCIHADLCERITLIDEFSRDNVAYCKGFKSAADVVEVRHARFEWGFQNGQYGIWCTNCGAGWVDSENAEWIAHEHDYCPKCGAKMDGKGDNA